MIYSNLWRYCVSTREFPAKFIKPRRRKSRAKRALAKKNSPLKRESSQFAASPQRSLITSPGSPLLPPEKPESEPGKPPIKPYLEDLTRRKRIVRSLKRRRTISRSQEEAQSHTTPSKFPTYKKGHFHLLQDGYIDFINSSYQNSRAVLSRWDVEQAWAGLVRGKFEEWRSEKRLKERLFKALGKAISKALTLLYASCQTRSSLT